MVKLRCTVHIKPAIYGVKGTGPLAGGSEGGRSHPFLSCATMKYKEDTGEGCPDRDSAGFVNTKLYILREGSRFFYYGAYGLV